ncbi:MAG: hypothetical protein AAGH40_05665 [Verrucomicrobiota bacterium]
MYHKAAFHLPPGHQGRGECAGRLYRRDALECGSRCVVGRWIRKAAKDKVTASMRAAAELTRAKDEASESDA